MLDFHSHILPGLDDGAPDMETALAMARIAVEDGITTMVATPHFIEGSMENNRDLILGKVTEFQRVLYEVNILLKVLPGCEVFLSPDTPARLQKGELMTVNNKGKHLLVELPLQCVPSYAEQVLFDLKVMGVTPVIAHPERNVELAGKPELFLNLVNRGCLMQINGGSINGLYGKKVQKAARILIINGLIHFIGSDGHSCNRRTTRIRKALDTIEKFRAGQKNTVMGYSNKVINGEDLIPITPISIDGPMINIWQKCKEKIWSFL
ncbi:MAG: hypothetical protein CVV03_07955 [Firmicutes bacterium HGW-Firmicutes-8]|nr:MAG: hypothetical protein CVV03_07955 [Firmicutes bacterium HGW-Firmicutes-8]